MCGKTHRIDVQGAEAAFFCSESMNLLDGMLRLGNRGIPAGCRGGGCGVCKVQILSGNYLKMGVMSRDHVSEDEELRGQVLACRVRPRDDVVLRVIGSMKKAILGRQGV